MFDRDEDYSDEARDLLKLIDVYTLSTKEVLFTSNMKNKIKRDATISYKEVCWLRDIKDKQL
jgi:hypothetical protein